MEYGLPTKVNISGEYFKIRYDFRVIMDIFEAINDPDMDNQERVIAVLTMFYPDYENLPDYEEAVKKLFWFINGGEEAADRRKRPKLVDWQQDYRLIIAPVNRVLGQESRSIPYDAKTNTGGLHWWTFLAAYQEIGDCLFAQVVRIRNKKQRGKKLDKAEQEFYSKNRDIIDIKTRYSKVEEEFFARWLGQRGAADGQDHTEQQPQENRGQ